MKFTYDFYRIEGPNPVYMEIENCLSRIGIETELKPSLFQKLFGIEPVPSNPWVGFTYKHRVLKAAGWDVDIDGSYTSDPDKAARVFLRIGRVLGKTKDPEEIIRLVEQEMD